MTSTETTSRPRRMSRAMCKLPQDCHLCPQRIKGGQRMALDFDNGLWAHLGCLVRKISSKRRDEQVAL